MVPGMGPGLPTYRCIPPTARGKASGRELTLECEASKLCVAHSTGLPGALAGALSLPVRPEMGLFLYFIFLFILLEGWPDRGGGILE